MNTPEALFASVDKAPSLLFHSLAPQHGKTEHRDNAAEPRGRVRSEVCDACVRLRQ